MHASNHAVILRQWSEWNETTYDILIASVKLSPTQHAYTSPATSLRSQTGWASTNG